MRYLFTLLLLSLLSASQKTNAQGAAYLDPAQAYVRLLLEKSESSYVRIGNYKVKGTPYLFGERHAGDVYAKSEQAKNVVVSYNTYDQTLVAFSAADEQAGIVKALPEVDSFVLRPQGEQSLMFINPVHVGAKDKAFLQRVAAGGKLTLYKQYFSELSVVSTNIVQADLRQFDLNYTYYYYDAEKRQLRKLRTDEYSVKKELGRYLPLEPYLSNGQLFANLEAALVSIFTAINKQP